MIDLKYLIGICTILLGGTLWLLKPIFNIEKGSREKGLLIILCFLTALSLFYYIRFGKFHNLPGFGSQNFHQGEVYVYYVGSKYYKETGNYDLYSCTAAAFEEIRKEPGAKVPKIDSVMNLRNKKSVIKIEQIRSEYTPLCHKRFSEARWESFKKDLRAILHTGPHDAWWRTTLIDAGYNSSPIFASIVGPIAHLLPFDKTWKFVGYFDMLLVALAAFFIWRSFGIFPCLAFLLFFATNPMSNYIWIGGSFFRLTWFAALAIALCLLKDEKYFWAGIIFGYSAGDRMFPLLFFFGALIPLVYQWVQSKGQKRNVIPLLTGFLISVGVLFLLSLVLYGPEHWGNFIANMKVHNRPFFIPHVGLKKAVIYFKGIHPQNFWHEEGFKRFNAWNERVQMVFDRRKIFYYPAVLFLSLGSIWVSRKKTPAFAATLIGGALLYALMLPARYYYVYLALFPVAFYQFPSSRSDSLRLFLSFLLMFSLMILPMLPPDDILLNIYFSYAIGVFLALQILITGFEKSA